MVRLESIQKEAGEFVRARLTRIDDLDLTRFVFDYDLTFAVLFMNPDGGIYGRYGGRDERNAENRQSLAGLRHAMRAALARHRGGSGPAPVLAGREDATPYPLVRQFPQARRRGECFHCHEVKEVMIDHLRESGKWTAEMAWRYPLPERVGFALDIDRGDEVAAVVPESAAAAAGLARGDVVEFLGGAAVASLADAQYGLDHAPWEGETEVVWRRGDDPQLRRGVLRLEAGWKRSNLLWRKSMMKLVPVLDLTGGPLGADERAGLELGMDVLAFRLEGFIYPALQRAGVRKGDVLVGLGGEQPGNLDSEGIDAFVASRFQKGDRMAITVIRGGERMAFEVRFGRDP